MFTVRKITTMLATLSCLKHPIISFLERISEILPNLEKAYAFYYCEQDKIIKGVLMLPDSKNERNEAEVEILNIDDYIDTLNNKRKRADLSGWYSDNQINLKLASIDSKQLNIYNEEENRILQLSLKNNSDMLYDYLLIYFKENKGKTLLGNKNIILTNNEKPLIELLVKNIFNTLTEIEGYNKQAFEYIQQGFCDILNEGEQLKRRLQLAKDKLGKTYIELAKNHLKKLSIEKKMNSEFVLSKDAANKISEFTGTPESLEMFIEKAFNVMRHIYYSNKDGVIEIPGNILNFDIKESLHKEELKITGIKETDIDIYHKTIDVLNRYEVAAKKLIDEGKKINITNIGNCCVPPITAAAVSDSIKKHGTRINSLLGKYPERWLLIREKLGPVRNKIIASEISKYKIKSA